MKLTLLIIGCAFSVSSSAAISTTDTVGIEEMVKAFHQKDKLNESEIAKQYKWVYGKTPSNKLLIEYSSKEWETPLNQPYEWKYNGRYIYWKPKEKNQACDSLLSKYGGQKDWGWVSAGWLNDIVIKALPEPDFYCGFFVSQFLEEYAISNGTLKLRGSKANTGKLRQVADSILDQTKWYDEKGKEKKVVVINDGRKPVENYTEATALQLYVNKANKSAKRKANASFDLLFITNNNGTTSIKSLNTTALSKDEAQLLKSLASIVRKFPKNAFGSLWTTDGRVFPARYIHADYADKRWKFRDYMYEK